MPEEVPSHATDTKTASEILGIVEERLNTEAVAQMVEHIGFSTELSNRLVHTFTGIQRRIYLEGRLLRSTQEEVRNLILDVALLKRAIVSLGQVGVMERRRVEKELVLDLFPPVRSYMGAGVRIHVPQNRDTIPVDCESRIGVCKAACCRIFRAYLTTEEVESGRYDWAVREPYALMRSPYGCVYLQGGGCTCRRYDDSRPTVCRDYSCAHDKRIWTDYDKMVLNPQLEMQLNKLHVNTSLGARSADVDTSGRTPSGADTSGGGSASTGVGEGQGAGIVSQTHAKDNQEPVGPPDFSELRELMIPEPADKFVPPEAPPDEGPSAGQPDGQG